MHASANVVLHVGEFAYGDRPFEVTGAGASGALDDAGAAAVGADCSDASSFNGRAAGSGTLRAVCVCAGADIAIRSCDFSAVGLAGAARLSASDVFVPPVRVPPAKRRARPSNSDAKLMWVAGFAGVG